MSHENTGLYRAPGFYEDALCEAANAINIAAASKSTLIDADPEKKEVDNGSDDAGGNAPAPLAPFAHLHQAPLSQKEFSKPLWNSFYNSAVLIARGIARTKRYATYTSCFLMKAVKALGLALFSNFYYNFPTAHIPVLLPRLIAASSFVAL